MGSKQVSCDKIPNAVRIYINMSASPDFVFQNVKKMNKIILFYYSCGQIGTGNTTKQSTPKRIMYSSKYPQSLGIQVCNLICVTFFNNL